MWYSDIYLMDDKIIDSTKIRKGKNYYQPISFAFMANIFHFFNKQTSQV